MELLHTAEYGPLLVQVGLDHDDPDIVLVEFNPNTSISRKTGVTLALYSRHCPDCGVESR